MDYLKQLFDLMFTLFNRKTVIPVTIAIDPDSQNTLPDTLPQPDNLAIVSASETRYRVTGNRTFFLWIVGGVGALSFTFSRDSKVVKSVSAAADAAGLVRVEHNLIPGDYSIVATDTEGKSSPVKTVTVQPSDADLTILSITQSGYSLSILLDAGRGNLGPYEVNIFKANGQYLTTVSSTGTNPIVASPGIGPGTYFIQVIERSGYWSNMAKFTYSASGSSGSATDDFNLGLDSFFTLPTIDDVFNDDDLPDREGNVVGLKPVQKAGYYTDMDTAGTIENGRRIRKEWGRTYWGHYFLNGVPHVDAQGMPLPFVDVLLPDNQFITLRAIYVDPNWLKVSDELVPKINASRTSQGGDDNFVFGANSVHITT
jgi:hypothetical protein